LAQQRTLVEGNHNRFVRNMVRLGKLQEEIKTSNAEILAAQMELAEMVTATETALSSAQSARETSSAQMASFWREIEAMKKTSSGTGTSGSCRPSPYSKACLLLIPLAELGCPLVVLGICIFHSIMVAVPSRGQSWIIFCSRFGAAFRLGDICGHLGFSRGCVGFWMFGNLLLRLPFLKVGQCVFYLGLDYLQSKRCMFSLRISLGCVVACYVDADGPASDDVAGVLVTGRLRDEAELYECWGSLQNFLIGCSVYEDQQLASFLEAFSLIFEFDFYLSANIYVFFCFAIWCVSLRNWIAMV